jgi:hypothetical protein
MATQPVICPVPEVPGFTFSRGSLVLDDGTKTTPPVYLDLKDMQEELVSFSKSRVILKASKCFLLSQTDIGDDLGYVSFIAIKATFPDLTVESKKYLTWTYEGVTNNMGTLMVLSGKRISAISSVYEGWLLSKPGVYSQNGGIVFCNPHSNIDIKLEILVAR